MPGVVGTFMTNMAIEVALTRVGVAQVAEKVGDRYVLEELTERGWEIGREHAEHLLALELATTRGEARFILLRQLKQTAHDQSALGGVKGERLEPLDLMDMKNDGLVRRDGLDHAALKLLR